MIRREKYFGARQSLHRRAIIPELHRWQDVIAAASSIALGVILVSHERRTSISAFRFETYRKSQTLSCEPRPTMGEFMKLSIEAKVAAAVAAAFIGLTAGAIAPSQSAGQPPNEYAPSANPSVSTHMGQRGYKQFVERRRERAKVRGRKRTI
jgi:hypothetical protein